MTTVTNEQRTENMKHVRGLLKCKQSGFSATLELAADMVRQELQEKPRVIQGRLSAYLMRKGHGIRARRT